MKWFGQSWGAPMCREQDHVPVPVGALCHCCKEPILENEIGVVVPVMSTMGSGSAPFPEHYECFMRGTIGSIGHQAGLCSCPTRQRVLVRLGLFWTGGPLEDIPGLTRRQQAQSALEFHESPTNAAIRSAILARWLAIGAGRIDETKPGPGRDE